MSDEGLENAALEHAGGPWAVVEGAPAATGRREKAYLVAAAAVVLAVTLVRLATSLPNYASLNHVSGIWITQATDLADGVFYRPLASAEGYGGTRYMPLHFLLHAMLIKMGGGPVSAGYAIAIASALALCAGAYTLMRRLGVSRVLAGPSAVFWLATMSGQLAVTTIRGDLLPAALVIWGLAFCLQPVGKAPERFGILPAAVFFVLAFSGKITAAWGFAAGFAAFFLSGRRREALRLAAATLGGMVLVAGGIYLASGGRWLESMQVCLFGGGNLKALLLGPAHLARMAAERDIFSLMLWMLALALILASGRDRLKRLETLAFLAVAAVTGLMSGSPGVDFNNLLDLNVMALVLFVGGVESGRVKRLFGVAALAVLVVCASAFAFAIRFRIDMTPARKHILDALRAAGQSEKPLLSEHPLIVILADEAPVVLDPFAFRLICKRYPSVGAEFLARLKNRDFRAAILLRDPRAEPGRRCYRETHFCSGFADALLENYSFAARCGDYYVFRPK